MQAQVFFLEKKKREKKKERKRENEKKKKRKKGIKEDMQLGLNEETPKRAIPVNQGQ